MGTAPKEYQAGGGGAGAGGKVRKKPYRNTQATPYDRPRTALRNPTDAVKNPNGWLSRLVDPASKLISTSARKLISSVFSKRIPPFSASKKSASDGVLQSKKKFRLIFKIQFIATILN
uniref:Uncharacterized protein n=1 Tax=Kalanchoe fedtschenkoi TaxID=63787 RepID=A0A7N0TED1_KALFE